ncbi:MAG: UDP-N-acetylmuramoylalanyl-D-glutamyl-2, 6-diaminopimelate--D-alanyl-D-alanine ligase, partial [Acidimicrobiales bacterium]
MRFTIEELASATGGESVGASCGVETDGVSIDSRSVHTRQLFVPIVAERDGHEFIPQAIEAGAGAYLTARHPMPGGPPAIEVRDTS